MKTAAFGPSPRAVIAQAVLLIALETMFVLHHLKYKAKPTKSKLRKLGRQGARSR